MAIDWQECEQRLKKAARLLNRETPARAAGPCKVGIDLGTADVVLMALDAAGQPVAAFLEWAEVVRDGVVVDYLGAVEIVRRLLAKAQARLGREITAASTSFPPGTDPRLSTHVLESAGLEVQGVLDEPSCVAALLKLDRTAVVDIGGGTTGTAVVKKGRVVHSADDPSGGRHISLVIAGRLGVSFAEAERYKRDSAHRAEVFGMARPTLERMSDLVARHIQGHQVARVILTGGTCCLKGVEQVFAQELGLPVELPAEPLLLTPLAIASLDAA